MKRRRLAALVAPYRHARLSAMKLAGDPNNPVRIRDDATLEELRAEMHKHLNILIEGGLIDLEALLANVDQSITLPFLSSASCRGSGSITEPVATVTGHQCTPAM
jgi:hypothetical protein